MFGVLAVSGRISDSQIAGCAGGDEPVLVVAHGFAVEVVHAVCDHCADAVDAELAAPAVPVEHGFAQFAPGPGAAVLPAFAHAASTRIRARFGAGMVSAMWMAP